MRLNRRVVVEMRLTVSNGGNETDLVVVVEMIFTRSSGGHETYYELWWK